MSLTSLPIRKARNNGGIGHANLLQIPMILIRLAALSNGPRIVIYGLTDACKNAFAVPLTKDATRKSAKLS